MTARSVWVYVALVAGAFGLVAGLGALERNPQVLEGPRQVAWGWLLGVDDTPQEPTYTMTVTIDREGVVRRNGEEVDQVAKTQVTDESMPVSGTLSMLNADNGATGGTAIEYVSVGAGSCGCGFWDATGKTTLLGVTVPPPPDEDAHYVIMAYIQFGDAKDYEFFWFTADEAINLEWSYSIAVDYGRRVDRDETLTPSGDRDAAPAYAADRDVADEWQEESQEYAAYSVTFGSLSWSENVPMGGESPPAPITQVSFHVRQHHLVEGVQYASGTLEWEGADYDLSRYWKDLGNWRFEGIANGIEVHADADQLFLDTDHLVQISPPRMWDFGKAYASVDRDGNPHSDLCLSGPWQASNHCPDSLTWATTPDGETFGASPGDTVYPTVADLYALGVYVDPASVTGLDYRDPDDSYKFFTSAKMQVSLTQESVEREDLVEAYGHYSGDLEVMMRIPPLSATTCDASPDVSGIMALVHQAGTGIYGPEDGGARALDHDDWTPGANTTTPNLSGEFSVGLHDYDVRGTGDVDGDYWDAGTYNGRTRYEHDGTHLYWAQVGEDEEESPIYAWVIHSSLASFSGPSEAEYYQDDGTTPDPKDATWYVGTGSGSAPAVTAVGDVGSLELSLPSNYGSRLDAVPSQNFPTGMPGYPNQYWTHQAGAFREYDGDPDQSGGTHSEPLEAVFCCRGFPALDLSGWTVPADCELTIRIDYTTYAIGDTHVPDSTRQTDATNTPSTAQRTYTVQATALGGIPHVMLGAPDEGGGEPDLEVVTKITIEGLAAGNWVMEEPELAGDPDSSEADTLKIFESPRDDYRHGGYSAVVDHVCHYALMDSHESNGGHSTRLEPTVRMFDHVHSPPTSEMYVDLTSAFSRTQIASLLSLVGDAFRATTDDTEFDAHYKDIDGSYLTTGYAFDFCHPLTASRPLEQPLTDINFAVRARSWTSVTGVVYGAYFDHVGGGAIHGQGFDDSGDLLRNDTSETIYRQPQGSDPEEWASVEIPTSDSAGYWRSSSGEVYEDYDPATVLWEYGLGESAESVTSTGRWATREYDYATLAAGGAPGVPWLHWMTGGWLHIAVAQDGVVRYYWTHPFSSAPTLQDTGAHPFGEAGGFSNPFITSYSCGWLLAGATDANGMRLSLSRDFGGSWEEIEGATLVSDLRDGCVAIQDGVLAACGWKDNTIVFRSASGTSYAAESLYIGGPTQATICAAVEDTRSQVLWVNGVLEALVEGVGYYRTRDWGTSWTQVSAPHIADGMTGGTCTFVDGEVLASGIEAGEVRVESAYRDDRTPEAFYIGGPTHIAVVEASMRNAVEAVHGERWVATGEDGLTLYRTRNPADGFAKII